MAAGNAVFYHLRGDDGGSTGGSPKFSRFLVRSIASIPSLEPAPEAPSRLRVIRWISRTAVRLAWDENSGRALGYRIQRASGEAQYGDRLPANPREGTIGVDDGKPTTLRIAAWNLSGETSSEPVTITLPPTFPRGDADGDGQVTILDVFRLIDATIFHGAPPFGDPDANRDGHVGMGDVFWVLDFLYRAR